MVKGDVFKFLFMGAVCLFFLGCSLDGGTRSDRTFGLLNQTEIIVPDGRNAQILKQAFDLKLNIAGRRTPHQKKYRLEVSNLKISTPQTLNNRVIVLRASAKFTLYEGKNIPLFSGNAGGIENYVAGNNRIIEQNARIKAIENVWNQTANIIILRIKGFLVDAP